VPVLIPLFSVLVLSAAASDPSAVLESGHSPHEIALDPDPASRDWIDAPRVQARVDRAGQPIPGPPTEIRSRWTNHHLYLLFVCPYTELNLKPDPMTTAETPRLWNWDVAETFIGSDDTHIGRYKEFQVSPQGEWVDLDIDRDDQKAQLGAAWNSGYSVRARIDRERRIWYGLMRIPFTSIDTRPPERGRELRIGLFRISGTEPRERHTWRPTGGATFHTPEAFGTLRLH
jgi:hypothetical protein